MLLMKAVEMEGSRSKREIMCAADNGTGGMELPKPFREQYLSQALHIPAIEIQDMLFCLVALI